MSYLDCQKQGESFMHGFSLSVLYFFQSNTLLNLICGLGGSTWTIWAGLKKLSSTGPA